ncbi:MAG: HAD-IIB family hydrolase [Acidimicrobiia bacterium]|nr:HAD-IIB family hydrolase [Acidimicrobiia bacterium]
MRRRVIAFDLDGTLAVSKSAISDTMADLVGQLLNIYDVCVISGGKFEQFELQVIRHLDVDPRLLSKLHIMPTSGTSYLRYDEAKKEWKTQYSEDLDPDTRAHVKEVLIDGAKELGLWNPNPYGEIVEDRGSQITFSALGQAAPVDQKHRWDPDGAKKESLRAYAAQRLPHLEVRTGGTTSIDVTALGIDKAYGMHKLMTALGLTMRDILFFGDKLDEGGNDHPVKAMGIDSIAVRSPDETAVALEAILKTSERIKERGNDESTS